VNHVTISFCNVTSFVELQRPLCSLLDLNSGLIALNDQFEQRESDSISFIKSFLMAMANSLGIFMDHSSAQIIEFTTDPMESITVDSTFSRQDKVESLGKSENLMHNKEQQQQTAYFKQLADVIKNYDAVVLFGPTDAKAQLYNILKADNRFEKIKIEVKQSDKMTSKQQNAFVRDYFSKQQIIL
jgi:hypothetical protein